MKKSVKAVGVVVVAVRRSEINSDHKLCAHHSTKETKPTLYHPNPTTMEARIPLLLQQQATNDLS